MAVTNQAVYWDAFSRLLVVMEQAVRELESTIDKPQPLQAGTVARAKQTSITGWQRPKKRPQAR